MNYSYDKFLRPLTDSDRSIKIIDNSNEVKYTIDPFAIINTSVSNNLLKISLRSLKVISIDFASKNESTLALSRIKSQIDYLTSKTPILISKDVKLYIDELFNSIELLQGPTGNDGIAGPQGPTGIQGSIGPTGIGLQGATGNDGIQGPIGPTGPTGTLGNPGIENWIVNYGSTGVLYFDTLQRSYGSTGLTTDGSYWTNTTSNTLSFNISLSVIWVGDGSPNEVINTLYINHNLLGILQSSSVPFNINNTLYGGYSSAVSCNVTLAPGENIYISGQGWLDTSSVSSNFVDGRLDIVSLFTGEKGATGPVGPAATEIKRYAYWAPYISTDPSGMGATYVANNATNNGENGIELTNTNSGGQNALINWSSTSIDWTKNFKMSVVVYLSTYPAGTVGDGFVLYAGTTAPVNTVYADSADNGLKFRLFTYDGASTPHQSGASFWLNTTKSTQGKTGNSAFLGLWARYTVEVCTDLVTNKRIAYAYFQDDINYGGKWPLAAMDITSWLPTGNNFGFYCSTGAARSSQYISTITFEAI